MIEIIPAIDIIDGRCVRLTKGDYGTKKVYDSSPVDMAKRYEDCGVKRIHLVDLDGAKVSDTVNVKTLEQIASSVDIDIEWGGGLANDAALRRVFDAGADCAIVGSVAALHPELFESWLAAFGGGRMVLGADVRRMVAPDAIAAASGSVDAMDLEEYKIAVKGWLETTQLAITNLMGRFSALGLTQAIVTDIGCDGMLKGPNSALYAALQAKYPSVTTTVSGGISSMTDIEALDKAGLKRVIVGKAIYENRISLEEIEKWSQNA